jgi:PAS domain S-box-containing protein
VYSAAPTGSSVTRDHDHSKESASKDSSNLSRIESESENAEPFATYGLGESQGIGRHAGIDEEQLQAARVALLYRLAPAGLFGALVSTLVLTVALWTQIPKTVLIGWAILATVVYAARVGLVIAFRKRSPTGAAAIPWGRYYAVGATVAGLIWGVAAIVLFPTDSSLHQALLVILIGGLSSGTVLVYSPLKEAYRPYVLTGGLPLSFMFLSQGDALHLMVGAMVLVYVGVLLMTGGRMYASTTENIKLRFEKDDFIRLLERQKAEAEKLSDDLSVEVVRRGNAEEAIKRAHAELEKRVEERTTELARANTSLKEEIEERKALQQDLLKEKSKFEDLSGNAPFGICLIDSVGTVLYVNSTFEQLFGYDSESIPHGREWFRLVHPDPDDGKEAFEAWNETRRAAQPGEARPLVVAAKCKDGARRVVHFRSVKLETGEDLVTCEDITAREEAEVALKESEERYRELSESSMTGIFIHQDGLGVYVNKRLVDMLGYAPEEMIGQPFLEAVHPDDRSMVAERALARLLGEPSLPQYELRMLKKTGEVIWAEVSATLISHQGRPAIMGNLVDVSERKRAEEELRKSEERYRSLFEESIAPILDARVDGTIIQANRACEDLFGYTSAELIGSSILALYADPEDRSRFRKDVERYGFVRDYLLRFRKKDGTLIECINQSSVRKSDDGTIVGYRGTLRDVTEQKALEKQLLETRKMEAIGTLAGGISHDFNNLLQIISGHAELLELDLADRNITNEELAAIRHAAQRGADLVKQILTFSRRVDTNFASINLNEDVKNTVRLLERTITKMIHIDLHLHDGLKPVLADSIQIEQVLINLAVNAQDAMPEGGTLNIETQNVYLNEQDCRSYDELKPGQYVLMRVSDTGHGMEEDVMHHIFEPFFTTKSRADGTGLGLSTVFGIVKMHSGHIACTSEPGKGTAFDIYLPATEKTPPTVVEERQPDSIMGGTETVLVVEDEPVIRNFAKHILMRAGYGVITARSGTEAVRIYEEEQARIALVILDLIMPEMGGRQCIQQLLKIDPQINVLIASGLAVNEESKEFLDSRAKGILTKPFNKLQLLRAVRDAIDSA